MPRLRSYQGARVGDGDPFASLKDASLKLKAEPAREDYPELPSSADKQREDLEMPARHEPQVLRPYHRSEALSIAEAAKLAGRSVRTVREWCGRRDLGRRIGGKWAVSRVALAMFLDGDREALTAYLRGDRSSTAVRAYFERCGVPVSKSIDGVGRA